MINIQKPTKEDVKGIQRVFYDTWVSSYPDKEIGITEDDIKEKFKNAFSEEAIKRRLKDISNTTEDKLFLVAKSKELIVGVCKIVKKEKFNQLEAIYVLPNYQKQGIGIMFWNEALKFWGNEKDIIVHVATYNEKAINFYKKQGFVDTGKRFVDEKFKMPISGACIPEMELVIKINKHYK